jgi:hypothetical protein
MERTPFERSRRTVLRAGLALTIVLAACGGGGNGGGFLAAAPDAPTNVTATAASASQVRISWNAVSGATGYNIYSSSTPAVDLVAAARVNASVVSGATYTDRSVLGNSTYYYKVTTVRPGGESGGSNLASAATGSWKIQQAPAMNTLLHLNSAAWSGTGFVAAGDAGTVYTSPTGSTWTAGTGLGYGVHRVRWINGQYYAAADYTSIYTSPTGLSWTERLTSGNNSPYHGIAWSGTSYLATGQDNANGFGTMATSATGTSWLSSYATPTTGTLLDVVWSHPSGTSARFVAVGSGVINAASPPGADFFYGSVYSSADGSTWSRQKVAGYNQILRAIAWSGTLYVAVGDYGAIFTSPDGGAWTAQDGGTSQGLRGVTWTGRQFVAVGASTTPGTNSVILTSPDGITWTSHDSGTETALNEVVWSGSNYVIVGNQATILSN